MSDKLDKSGYENSLGIQSYKKNPFIQDMVSKTNTSYKIKTVNGVEAYVGKNLAMVNKKTGELVDDDLQIGLRQRVDRTQFVKLYTAGMREAFDLTKRANELFMVILQHYSEITSATPRGRNDEISINLRIAQEIGYSRTKVTFRAAINELCKKRFIAPSALLRDTYFINPNFFFNGNRVTIIKQYELERDIEITSNGDPDLDQLDFNGETERERRAKKK